MNEQHLDVDRDTFYAEAAQASSVKLPYSPPCSVQLSGSKEEEYGVGIVAAAVWVIGIGPAWIW